jgi:hypothetical protein
MRRLLFLAVVASTIGFVGPAHGQTRPTLAELKRRAEVIKPSAEELKWQAEPSTASGSSLPQGYGLSAKYPGDRGIARDPHVLFAEDFEEGSLAEVVQRWSEASNKDDKVLALSSDVPPGSGGKRSIQMTATLGENTGGHLYKRLPRGVDMVFARFYVKFAPDAGYIHHFVHLGGYHPATSYPQGGAGERPRGDERITVGIEPFGSYGRYPAPGAWNFYTYWHEMKISADGKYWGNGIGPEAPALVPKNRWQCVEVMLKLNSAPEKPDGELALWLDGKLVMHIHQGVRRGPWSGMGFPVLKEGGEPFEGFRWRKSDVLKINFFWLLHYVTENTMRQNHVVKPNPTNRVWFDDIVVSTEYVGPIWRQYGHDSHQFQRALFHRPRRKALLLPRRYRLAAVSTVRSRGSRRVPERPGRQGVHRYPGVCPPGTRRAPSGWTALAHRGAPAP